ncbi:MAG: hypothetical protein ACE5KO_01770 [Candidatus Bathyarchaeia archaeon]
MTLGKIVESAFIYEPSCYVHCNKKAHFTSSVKQKESIVGAYLCPSNFVSRVVYFALKPDMNWFKTWLAKQMKHQNILHERDIRIATRHPWEVQKSSTTSVTAPRSSGLTPYVVREVYWAYPRAKLIEDKIGAFRCQECKRIFVQALESTSRLCNSCKKH